MSKQTQSRKSAANRKAEIVEMAIRLAADVGPDRLTTTMLAAEIGITQPAIFRHFPTKEAIWQAVGEHIGKRMELTAPADDNDDPTGQLRRMVLDHLDSIQKTPAIPAILFSRELHAENDALRQHFAELMANRQMIFAQIIERGIREREFAVDLDAKDAAYLVLALIQGLAMRWSLSGRSFDLVAEGGRLMAMQIAGFQPK